MYYEDFKYPSKYEEISYINGAMIYLDKVRGILKRKKGNASTYKYVDDVKTNFYGISKKHIQSIIDKQ